MQIAVFKTYEELSRSAAAIIREVILARPNAILGLATGSTPIGTYRELIRMHREEGLDFSRVTSFNLDEYYPISPENDQSYRFFMEKNLFSSINIRPECTHVPRGDAADAEEECRAYEDALAASAGIDIQLLGIGQNGHIGFNEPAEALVAETHLTSLTESTVKANARFFASEDEVPRHALTMGMASIFSARKILILAAGKEKRAAVAALRDGSITTSVPATLLKLHKDVILLCDEEAYGDK